MKLIDKDAVVAEIGRLKDSATYFPTIAEKEAYNDGIYDALKAANAIAIKIVTIKKRDKNEFVEAEIEDYLDKEFKGEYAPYNKIREMAKYFYELGLKTTKL